MKVQAFDIGGTGLRHASIETETGETLGDVVRYDSRSFRTNEQVAKFIDSKVSEEDNLAMCLTGAVNESELQSDQAPNSSIRGALTFPRILKEKYGHDVVITNDLRAAALGAAIFGAGKDSENVCIATYSSGYGAAVVRDGEIVTSAEIGHMHYKDDSILFCGCGGRGHIEPYVSGNGAAVMAQIYFLSTRFRSHPILDKTIERLNSERSGVGEEYIRRKDLDSKDIFEKVVLSIGAKEVYDAFRISP